MHDWSFGFGMGFMGLMPVLWLLLAGGAIWAVTAAASRSPASSDSPETALKRRYASGEISQEEYERRLAGLRR